MEDNLRRFRQGEQRQQPPARPFAQQFPDPYAIPASRIPVGAPATEIPQVEPPGMGPVLDPLERFTNRFMDPIAATALQTAQSPLGQALPGMPELRMVRPEAERLGLEQYVPSVERKSFRQLKEEGGFVNPIAAALGSEEEQRRAQGVLEESGFATALAFRIVTDPFNFVPVVGFTKVDDLLRALRAITPLKGSARTRAVTSFKATFSPTEFAADIPAARTAGAPKAIGADIAGPAAADVQTTGLIPSTVMLPTGKAAVAARVPLRTTGEFATPRLPGEGVGDVSQAGRLPPDVEHIVQGGTFTPPAVPPDVLAGGAIDRLSRIIEAVKPLRHEAELAKSRALRLKVGALRGIQAEGAGELGFFRGRAALRGPNLPDLPSALEPGAVVWAKDKGNLGRIVRLGDNTATVSFYNRQTGARATRELERELLTPLGGGEVRWQFTQSEVDAMIDHALKNPAAKARPLEAENARSALVKTLNGELPTTGEIALLEKYYGKDFAKAVSGSRPLGEKAWEAFVDAVNLPRTLMASYDVSFPLRQGIMVGPRHPKEFLGDLPDMFKGGFSERYAKLVDEALDADATVFNVLVKGQERPMALSELAADSGLYRAPIEGYGPLAAREEFFLSNLAKKIPLVGQGVRFSERAFITYGNKLRQDIFRNVLHSWSSGGKPITPEDAKALANLLNRMTGRGTLGPADQIAPLLSAGFFAPRFAVSRPQAVAQLFNWRTVAGRRAARMAAQEIASFVGLGTSILALAKLSGLDVEMDPLAADWGKIRIGNTRIDFWGGNIQVARLVAQLSQGKRTTSAGTTIPSSRVNSALRVLRFKESPPASAFTDWALGETAIGEKFPPTGLIGEGSITAQVARRTMPMAVQDLVEAILGEGMTGGFLGALAFGGVGVQTYETLPDAFEAVTGRNYAETPRALRDQLIREHNELQRFKQDKVPEGEQLRMGRSNELLAGAEAVLAGVPGAARAYHENRSNIMAKWGGAREWTFRTMDIKPVGRDNEILSQIYDVNFQEDRDGNGIPGDDDDVRLAIDLQEALRGQLSGPVQRALKNPENFFPDEGVAEVEGRRNEAKDKLDYLFDNIPKYRGATVEESERTDDYVRYVRQVQKDMLRKHGDGWGWTLPELATELGKEDGVPEVGQWASWALSDSIARSAAYDDFLIANQEDIAPFFPMMYQRTVFREKGALTDEVWREVNLAQESPVPSSMQAPLAVLRS